MTVKNKTACIFGGSGFLGKAITQELAQAGYRIKVATRIPESVYDLKPYGVVGQITAYPCNYRDENDIRGAVAGCDVVVNLVGILYQKGKNSFQHAHIDIPQRIATACADVGVAKFIHVSALGVNQGVNRTRSKYARSKLEGEKKVQEIYSDVTILRPSVIFGAGDSFLNMFSRMATLLPALPLIGGGKTKFQPVYVGDVADAVIHIVQEKTYQFSGNIYELGGPEIVSFKQILERLLNTINRDKSLVSVPWGLATLQGFLLGLLPKPLLTADQVKSLKTDNVVAEDALTLKDLGIQPTAMGTIIPSYLSCYRRGGRFADKKYA